MRQSATITWASVSAANSSTGASGRRAARAARAARRTAIDTAVRPRRASLSSRRSAPGGPSLLEESGIPADPRRLDLTPPKQSPGDGGLVACRGRSSGLARLDLLDPRAPPGTARRGVRPHDGDEVVAGRVTPRSTVHLSSRPLGSPSLPFGHLGQRGRKVKQDGQADRLPAGGLARQGRAPRTPAIGASGQTQARPDSSGLRSTSKIARQVSQDVA